MSLFLCGTAECEAAGLSSCGFGLMLHNGGFTVKDRRRLNVSQPYLTDDYLMILIP